MQALGPDGERTGPESQWVTVSWRVFAVDQMRGGRNECPGDCVEKLEGRRWSVSDWAVRSLLPLCRRPPSPATLPSPPPAPGVLPPCCSLTASGRICFFWVCVGPAFTSFRPPPLQCQPSHERASLRHPACPPPHVTLSPHTAYSSLRHLPPFDMLWVFVCIFAHVLSPSTRSEALSGQGFTMCTAESPAPQMSPGT